MNFWLEWVVKSPIVQAPAGSSGGNTIIQQFNAEPFYALVLVVLVIFFSMMLVKRYKQIRPMHADQKQFQDYGIPLTQSTRSAEGSGRPDEAERKAEVARPGQLEPSQGLAESSLPSNIDDRIDGVSDTDEPKDELIDWFLDQYTDDEDEKKEMRKAPEIDNKQHAYEEEKIDRRKTPEFRARFLENMRKAREARKHGKTKGVRPKGTGDKVREGE